MTSADFSLRATRIGGWLTRLEQRAHRNTVVVALANKLARTAWVILRQGREYDPAFGLPVEA